MGITLNLLFPSLTGGTSLASFVGPSSPPIVGHHGFTPEASSESRLIPLQISSVIRDGVLIYENFPFFLRTSLDEGRQDGSASLTEGRIQGSSISASKKELETNKHATLMRWHQASCYLNRWVISGAMLNQGMTEEINCLVRGIDVRVAREQEEMGRTIDALLDWFQDPSPDPALKEKKKMELDQLRDVFMAHIQKHPPGSYLYRDGMILGTTHEGRPAKGKLMYRSAVKKYLPAFFSAFNNTDLHPLVRAAKVYQDWITLHPAIDGNGRTARLLMDGALMRAGYPPPIGKLPFAANFGEVEIDWVKVRPERIPLSRVAHAIKDGIAKSVVKIGKERIPFFLSSSKLELPPDCEMDALTFYP